MLSKQLSAVSRSKYQLRSFAKNANDTIVSKHSHDELKPFMHGRKFVERRDSISREILMERKLHQERLASIEVDRNFVRSLEQKGLGSKKQNHAIYDQVANQFNVKGGVLRQTVTGAGGFFVHVASASKDWPIFKHLLPELVFAGHSNSGKV